MAAAIRAIRQSKVATFVSNYDQKGFFSLRWAAVDVCIICALLINHIK